MLKEGESIPVFQYQYGEIATKLQILKKTIVIYFYPKDFTPGCTTEADEFGSKDHTKFTKAPPPPPPPPKVETKPAPAPAKSKGTMPKGFNAESAPKPKPAPAPAQTKPQGTLPKGFTAKPAPAPQPAKAKGTLPKGF